MEKFYVRVEGKGRLIGIIHLQVPSNDEFTIEATESGMIVRSRHDLRFHLLIPHYQWGIFKHKGKITGCTHMLRYTNVLESERPYVMKSATTKAEEKTCKKYVSGTGTVPCPCVPQRYSVFSHDMIVKIKWNVKSMVQNHMSDVHVRIDSVQFPEFWCDFTVPNVPSRLLCSMGAKGVADPAIEEAIRIHHGPALSPNHDIFCLCLGDLESNKGTPIYKFFHSPLREPGTLGIIKTFLEAVENKEEM